MSREDEEGEDRDGRFAADVVETAGCCALEAAAAASILAGIIALPLYFLF